MWRWFGEEKKTFARTSIPPITRNEVESGNIWCSWKDGDSPLFFRRKEKGAELIEEQTCHFFIFVSSLFFPSWSSFSQVINKSSLLLKNIWERSDLQMDEERHYFSKEGMKIGIWMEKRISKSDLLCKCCSFLHLPWILSHRKRNRR